MTKTQKAKKVAKFVVGASVSFTVSRIARSNTPTENRIQDAEAYVGALALGMIAAEKAEAWTDRTIDAIINPWNENK